VFAGLCPISLWANRYFRVSHTPLTLFLAYARLSQIRRGDSEDVRRIMPGPLNGVKVLDLTQGYIGYCAMQMGDLGADVIKVESPDGDAARQWGPPFIQGESAAFLGVNRSKRGVSLNWRNNAESRRLLDRLIQWADVLVEDMSPSEAESFGLDYNAIIKASPQIVYCAITPFGEFGPYRNRPATELEIQGYSGMPRYYGEYGNPATPPIRTGFPIAATNTSLFALQAICAALFYRKRTGKAQKIDCSQLGGLVTMQTVMFAAESEPDEWIGHTLAASRPPNTGYQTKDMPILWGFRNDPEAMMKFLDAIGLPELKEDPRFHSPAQGFSRLDDLKPVFEARFKQMPALDILKEVWKLGGMGVPYYTFEGLANDPQVLEMDMVEEFDHPKAGRLKTIGIPYKFMGTPGEISLPPPLLGQHNEEVFTSLGYSPAELARLKKAGAF